MKEIIKYNICLYVSVISVGIIIIGIPLMPLWFNFIPKYLMDWIPLIVVMITGIGAFSGLYGINLQIKGNFA